MLPIYFCHSILKEFGKIYTGFEVHLLLSKGLPHISVLDVGEMPGINKPHYLLQYVLTLFKQHLASPFPMHMHQSPLSIHCNVVWII